MGCGQVSCSVLPEHFLHVGSVKIRLIDEVFEVDGLEVYCLKLRKLRGKLRRFPLAWIVLFGHAGLFLKICHC